MALTNLQANITLDVYDHDGARPSIKAIALDNDTRYVLANITYRGERYDIGSSSTVQLIVIRPDKVGVQVAGTAQEVVIGVEDETPVTIYGAYAELDQPAIAVAGTLLAQFKITSGEQVLRTQIFQIANGQALDAEEWAGDYDGYNLDELVADVAEAVEKVGDLETDVAQIKEDLSDLHVETETPINLWIQGTINLDTGEGTSSSYRCRSYGYFTSRDLGYGTARITIKSGLRLLGVAWNERMEYAGSISNDWMTGELTFEVKEGWSYRFVASKPSGSGFITPSECVDAFYIAKSGMTDDTLNINGKSADARAVKESLMPSTSSFNGNTSTIVAAKYFSYADGTQPVVDWYLLADYAGYIYISKDLKSKKYICKLPHWFQYKFVVRQNGDIIAVYRTELLSAASGATYDSTLDDCRKNPLVCLYSEGYAEWHEVDFGTSLKPTGWLENCGVCVLPNGDTIWGEYTRMMVVYTANLWRIEADADITSSSSWEVLKSYRVAQNDTDTYDETVIEHFHTVQTDPYTGTVYYATGDTGNKSQIWYSTDSGDNWTQQTFVDPDTSQTLTSGEKFFRLLNFNFTADKVYWSSDSGTEHAILKADRNGINGLTPNSIRVVTEIATATGKPATYGSVLYEDKKIMILMERCDSNATQMLFRAYDLVTNTLKTICTIKCAVNEAKNIGFRTEYTEFEPLDGIIKCGFGTHRYYINYNAICGNKGTEFINNVNTLNIRISMDADRNIYARFGTYYI